MSKDESAGVTASDADVVLDMIMVEAGQFGRYQWRLLAAAALVVVLGAWSAGEYIFTTARINTRCLIPECEEAGDVEFSPPWLANAVPSTEGAFDGCQRYVTRTPDVTVTADVTDGSCPAVLFDQNNTVTCEQYVYQNTHTVVYDLELACDEWRRSLIGSAHTIGTLVALPLTGLVSDRWGRRPALIISGFNTAWIGIMRYWVNSYVGFVLLEFAEASFGSSAFSTIYIILMELVGPQYRVRAGATCNSFFAVGMMLLGLLAWAVPNWRNLTLTLYVPQFLVISYFWIIPESFRWYKSKGRFDKVEESIKNVARVNRKTLSEKILGELKNVEAVIRQKSEENKEDEPLLIVQVFRHKAMLIRCITTPICWITLTLVFYGMSINSVNMVGNRYLNYALVSAVEIPGLWLAVVLLDRVGRRPVLAAGFWVCALCQVGYILISKDRFVVSLLIYLLGKSSIAMVGLALYIYTAELYPTRHRHTLFAFSSMMGRIGSIVAPLTPALGAQVFDALPSILFGGMAALSGALALLTPETRGARLPDTMRQAADMSATRER